jgi:hypothetical protein
MVVISVGESKSIRSRYMDFLSVCAAASACSFGGTVTERGLTAHSPKCTAPSGNVAVAMENLAAYRPM